MCAKPEPSSYLQPIVDLHEELAVDGRHHTLRDLSWAAVTALYGLLENV